MIICKVCGHQNEQGREFCASCGSFLEWEGAPQGGDATAGQTTDAKPPAPADAASTEQTPAVNTAPQPSVQPGMTAIPPAPERERPAPQPPSPTQQPAGPDQVICPNCGQANDRSRHFCQRCGTSLQGAAAASTATMQSVTAKEERQPSEFWIRHRTKVVVGAAALVLILVAGGLYFALGSGGSAPKPSPQPTIATRLTATLVQEGSFQGPGDQKIRRIVPFSGGMLAVGLDGLDGAVWRSADGLAWTQADSTGLEAPATEEILGAAELGKRLVAVGTSSFSETQSDGIAWFSSEGLEWEQVAGAPFGGYGRQELIRVTDGGPGVVAVGRDGAGAGVWVSEDGATWEKVQSEVIATPGLYLRGVAKWREGIVAVGLIRDAEGDRDAAAVFGPPDATTWERADEEGLAAPGKQSMISVTEFGNALVAVGSDERSGEADAAVWTSGDAQTWTQVSQATLVAEGYEEIHAVTTVPGFGLVAGGSDDGDAGLWTSRDGQTWIRVSDPAFVGPGDQVIRGFVQANGQLIAAGTNGADAGAWVIRLPPG